MPTWNWLETSLVRTVPLGENAGHFVEPTYDNTLDGNYPLARFLYIYVNQQPGQPLDKLTGEFIKYVLSHEGRDSKRNSFLSREDCCETLSGKN